MIVLSLVVALGFGLLQSCAALSQMAAVLANLQRLKFKLADVGDFRLFGIPLGGKAQLADFTAADGFRLVQAFAQKKLPAEFVLTIEAVNPNDGTGGSPETVSMLTSLESRLLIDGTPTVTGNIDTAIEIPGTGQSSMIPLRMSIDLYEFFGNKGYEGLINLALALGGARRDAARIALDALPSVSTPMGPIAYPGRLTIVSHEFR
jgi:hypothetical protein